MGAFVNCPNCGALVMGLFVVLEWFFNKML